MTAQFNRVPSDSQPPTGMAALPGAACVYVIAVTAAGLVVFMACVPRQLHSVPGFILLLTVSLAASSLKVRLPLNDSAANMSVSYVVDFLALLLFGPHETMILAVAGAWTQSRVHTSRKPPAYRVLFSMSVLVLTVEATGVVYRLTGGRIGSTEVFTVAKPLVAAATAYFLLNTGFVASAIALSTRQSLVKIWNDTFLWSAPSYFVGAGVAALAAVLIRREGFWLVPLTAAPVYLTYRTYKVYLGRIDDERRHVQEISRAHEQAVEALALAKRSEQALAAEKEYLRVTVRSIGDGVITTDVHGRILMLNQVAEAFTGWSQQSAVSRPLNEVFRLIDRDTKKEYENPVDKALKTQGIVGRDNNAALLSRDGTERLIEDSASPIRDNDGAVIGVVLVFRDVTDTVRLKEERLKANKLASLGVLAGGIAHDFNNIMTAILGNVSLARMEEGIAPETAAILEEAEKACARAKGLTRQLLTFSKGGAPVKNKVALGAILRDTATFALRGSRVRCELDVAPELWGVEADEGQISQVINNLVINAQQAMPDGGVLTIRATNVLPDAIPRPHAALVTPARYVMFSVEDRGVGIAEENVSKIFDPYFTTKQQGNGLGLATSYSIIKHHGGYMDVQSKVGVGTTMFVYLPAQPANTGTTSEVPQMITRTGKGRILLMDDEEMVSTLGRRILARLGYDVKVARDGGEAIQMYREAREGGMPFDAVIMDLTIPGGIGGGEAIHRLREIDPQVRAIVSSGYADDPVMAEFRQHGFAGVVPKPFTAQQLCGSLQKVLELQEALEPAS